MSELYPGKRKRNRFQLYAVLTLAMLFCSSLYFSLQAQKIPRLRIKEEAARDYFKKGVAFYNSRKYVAAREFFYKALNIHPYFHLARRFVGDSYYYSGEWNGAMEQWTFLDDLSGNSYPLIEQRYSLLRYYLNRYKEPGAYTYHTSYSSSDISGSMKRPADLFLDENGVLTVLSYVSGNMTKFDISGNVVEQTNSFFFNSLDGPVAFTFDEGSYFVCEFNADRVSILSEHGLRKNEFGSKGSGDGQFRGPSGIAVTNKAIYVTDSGNNRIQKFNREGKFLFSFGKDDRGQNLRYPAGIEIDADMHLLYVADRNGKRIVIYDTDGNYTGELLSPLLQEPRNIEYGKNGLWISDEKAGILHYKFKEQIWEVLNASDENSENSRQFKRPFSVREDESGILYVADYSAERIDIIAPRGLRTSNLDVKVESVDTTSFPDIALFVRVRNRFGVPLAGIPSNKFKIFENDRRIGIIRTDNIRPYNTGMNLVFVNESTETLQQNGYDSIYSVIYPLLKNIRINDKIKIIRTGEQVRSVYEGLHRLEIIRNLTSGDTAERPNLGKGLYEGITQLVREIGPRSIVLLVSGKYYSHTFSQYSLQRIIQYANSHDINVNVISYENEEDADQKNDMKNLYMSLASETGGSYIHAYDETTLRSLYEKMRDRKDKRYIVTYKALYDGHLTDRYMDVRVEVNNLQTSGIGDGGYFVPVKE